MFYLYIGVLIAGSGPVGATYARIIHDIAPDASLIMADIGSQDSPVIGVHHKNSIKYQKDIDQFVHVIKGALQPISVPREDTFIPNLGGQGWKPSDKEKLIIHRNNPAQAALSNLKASAVTRAVGGMGTHWTCACPIPHQEERGENPIPPKELDELLHHAGRLLNVKHDQYDMSIRHNIVKNTLASSVFDNRVHNLPLAVERRKDNPDYVTWSGPDTILGGAKKKFHPELLAEHRVTKVVENVASKEISGVLLRDLNKDEDKLVLAKAVILCCGAVATPQILFNSGIKPDALGHYLCEQSIAFCQIVLKKELIDGLFKLPLDIRNFEKYFKHLVLEDKEKDFKDMIEKITNHHTKYHDDPLWIPFADPEPQITLPYSPSHPWHVQIHRDAFSYGEVGPRADSRVVVDLRWFGKQTSNRTNRVTFSTKVTDIYGMPQPTFQVERSKEDNERDQRMMGDMTQVANILGSYLPGSYPQFMDPGLALHITGTTRIGRDKKTSVADEDSRVHGYKNLWVGGNGCIPSSTACNPTRTSVAIAIKGANAVVNYLKSKA